MHECYFNYEKLCQLDTYIFVVHVKTKGIDKGIAKGVEEKLGTLNYDLKMKIKNELGVKICWSQSQNLQLHSR